MRPIFAGQGGVYTNSPLGGVYTTNTSSNNLTSHNMLVHPPHHPQHIHPRFKLSEPTSKIVNTTPQSNQEDLTDFNSQTLTTVHRKVSLNMLS